MKKYLSEYPNLIKEFHPTKNCDLKPENLTIKSEKKVWWKCPKGDDHEWKTSVTNRIKGFGCPYCSSSGTSEPETRILCVLEDDGF